MFFLICLNKKIINFFTSRKRNYFYLFGTLVALLLVIDTTVKRFAINLERQNFGRQENDANNLESSNNEFCEKGKPNYEYEIVRRRLRHTIDQFTLLFSFEVQNMLKYIDAFDKLKNKATVEKLAATYKDFKNSLLNDLATLKKEDGFDNWRLKEFKDLSNIVQTKIKKLQNPKDCSNAKRLLCVLNDQCGFGCQIHQVVSALMSAYFNSRTLVLVTKGWHYNKDGWEGVLTPLSDTCVDTEGPISDYPGHGTKIVRYPQFGYVQGHRPYEIPNLPHDINARLNYIHDYPFIWWAGQFTKYILRYPQKTAEKIMKTTQKSFKHQHAEIGIHVRRTDKIDEAKYYPLATYMEIVEDYVNRTMIGRDPKKKVPIFLATDEIKVVDEARKNYTNYEFITDPNIGDLKPVNNGKDRDFDQTIFNVHALSHMKFLVCTFSSNFGRLCLENSQHIYPDETVRYYSLDTDWMWPKGNGFHEQAFFPHIAKEKDELSFEVGDVIHLQGLDRNSGYLRGYNYRTGKTGTYPAFKTKHRPTYTQYPKYL